MSEWTGIGTFHSNRQTKMTTGMELISMDGPQFWYSTTCFMATKGAKTYQSIPNNQPMMTYSVSTCSRTSV
jgi:hypothetical protein